MVARIRKHNPDFIQSPEVDQFIQSQVEASEILQGADIRYVTVWKKTQEGETIEMVYISKGIVDVIGQTRDAIYKNRKGWADFVVRFSQTEITPEERRLLRQQNQLGDEVTMTYAVKGKEGHTWVEDHSKIHDFGDIAVAIGGLRKRTEFDVDQVLLIQRLEARSKEIQQQANHDALTGLPNRRYFDARLQEELEKTQRSGHNLSVLCIDLDGFKAVNTALGHKGGDDALVVFARSLSSDNPRLFRPNDLIARVGGDEFYVILPDTKQEDAIKIAQRLLNAVNDNVNLKFTKGDTVYLIGCTIGVGDVKEFIENGGDLLDQKKFVDFVDQRLMTGKTTLNGKGKVYPN